LRVLKQSHKIDIKNGTFIYCFKKRELMIGRRKPEISFVLVLKRKKQQRLTKIIEIDLPYKATINISSQISASLLSFHTNQLDPLLGFQ